MAKKKPVPAPEKSGAETYETTDLMLRLPRSIYDEALRRAGNESSVQAVIILTLCMVWQVPPPPLRRRGGQRKKKEEKS